MQAAPLAAIDLPLKLLVLADGDQTIVSYADPAALAARYGLSDELSRAVVRSRGGRRRGARYSLIFFVSFR